MRNRTLLLFSVVSIAALFLCACETTPTRVTRSRLPTYEPPMARANIQHIRTTAYTHTEADHLAFGNHNALGGTLRAAIGRVRRVEIPPPQFQNLAETTTLSIRPAWPNDSLSFATLTKSKPAKKNAKTVKRAKAVKKKEPQIGSAAADWARWPVGTTFRLLSTGQVYRVDDYGWALAGRNTIDLYMATRADMNAWGVRDEGIEILHWGDFAESLRLLRGHQSFRHIQRMVLELEGNYAGASELN